jgi:hypothetical protein
MSKTHADLTGSRPRSNPPPRRRSAARQLTAAHSWNKCCSNSAATAPRRNTNSVAKPQSARHSTRQTTTKAIAQIKTTPQWNSDHSTPNNQRGPGAGNQGVTLPTHSRATRKRIQRQAAWQTMRHHPAPTSPRCPQPPTPSHNHHTRHHQSHRQSCHDPAVSHIRGQALRCAIKPVLRYHLRAVLRETSSFPSRSEGDGIVSGPF